jgi:hypothetical protein
MGSEWIFREIGCGWVWIRFDWLGIGTDGELLWMQWWTFGFLRHGVSYCVTLSNILLLPLLWVHVFS